MVLSIADDAADCAQDYGATVVRESYKAYAKGLERDLDEANDRIRSLESELADLTAELAELSRAD